METCKFVIDFESLIGKNGEFIIKELSIMPIDGLDRDVRTTTFKAPYPWFELPPKVRRANMWATHHLHHIQWYDGWTEYNVLQSVVQSVTGVIYVKGLEKALFVSRLAGRAVFELGALGCPKIEQQRLNLNCPIHLTAASCSDLKCRNFAAWCYEHLPTMPPETVALSRVGGSTTKVNYDSDPASEAWCYEHLPAVPSETIVHSLVGGSTAEVNCDSDSTSDDELWIV